MKRQMQEEQIYIWGSIETLQTERTRSTVLQQQERQQQVETLYSLSFKNTTWRNVITHTHMYYSMRFITIITNHTKPRYFVECYHWLQKLLNESFLSILWVFCVLLFLFFVHVLESKPTWNKFSQLLLSFFLQLLKIQIGKREIGWFCLIC